MSGSNSQRLREVKTLDFTNHLGGLQAYGVGMLRDRRENAIKVARRSTGKQRHFWKGLSKFGKLPG